MTDSPSVQHYLATFRAHLRPMTLGEREDIVREIRAHIHEVAAEGLVPPEVILQRLGPPQQLAQLYCNGWLLPAAGEGALPFPLFRSAVRLATRGLTGMFVLILAIIGYTTTAALVITACLKLLFPANVGTWVWNGHFMACGLLFPPLPGAQELLGWNYIPVALITAGFLWAATQAAIRFAWATSRRLQGLLRAEPLLSLH